MAFPQNQLNNSQCELRLCDFSLLLLGRNGLNPGGKAWPTGQNSCIWCTELHVWTTEFREEEWGGGGRLPRVLFGSLSGAQIKRGQWSVGVGGVRDEQAWNVLILGSRLFGILGVPNLPGPSARAPKPSARVPRPLTRIAHLNRFENQKTQANLKNLSVCKCTYKTSLHVGV